MSLPSWQFHTSLDYCTYIISLEIKQSDSPTLFFIFKMDLAILIPLPFHDFRIVLSPSTESLSGISIGIALNS